MIELQTALAIAGLVVFLIVLIISYDKYRLHKIGSTEHRMRERSESQEPELPQEISVNLDPPQSGRYTLLSPKTEVPEEPKEPILVDPLRQEIEDTEKFVRTPIHGMSSMETLPDDSPLDGPQIEFVARIPGSNMIRRDTALGLYRQHEYELKKPHRIFGLSHPGRVWVNLEQAPANAMFTDFGITIQLVDRGGPILESELTRFTQIVLRFSEVFGRRFKFSMEVDEALRHAKEVDDLCKKYDSLAILNVLTREAGFRHTDIDKHARELGMRMSRRRIYQKVSREGDHVNHMYSLANLYGDGAFEEGPDTTTTGGITLFMNIPSTRDPGNVFNDMVADAKELCRRLNGKLVDQNKRGMTENGIEAIHKQIERIASDMRRDGIEPGGMIASLLF